MNTKICVRCKKELPQEEFYNRYRKNREEKSSYCKECHNKASAEYKLKRKIEAINYLGGKCIRCGYSESPYALEFHHLDPSKKDFNIGKRITKIERMKEELDKCILLCANCHRIEHSGDKYG